MLLQVLDGSHGNEAACPLNAEHLQSCEKMYILNSLLYLQVTGLARIQNVKWCCCLAIEFNVNAERNLLLSLSF